MAKTHRQKGKTREEDWFLERSLEYSIANLHMLRYY